MMNNKKQMKCKCFTEEDWNYYAECYDGLNALTPYRALKRGVTRALLQPTKGRILEAACGTGNFTKHLLQHAKRRGLPRPEIYAVDYSDAMLARAKAKCGENAYFIRADLNQPLVFPDRYFEVIVSVNTLYALRDPDAMLREFARLLEPGGRLILVTPKVGYENGLILKEHCGSSKPDTYWEHIHRSQKRERELIHEACGNTKIAAPLIAIAAHNRNIAQTHSFHFFTEDTLRAQIGGKGFSLSQLCMVYAGQCFMATLTKHKQH